MKVPQLRLIVTDYCDSKCVYCRPTGESLCKNFDKEGLSLKTAIEISKLYKENGGNDIKITGGDPVYWKHLSECIKILKNCLNIEKVEVITRSIKIKNIIDELIENGLDSINFSLDTLKLSKYRAITGKKDLQELLGIIKYCSLKMHCKINTVVMKGINDDEVGEIVEFCRNNNIDELKFLDIIDDLHKSKDNNSDRLNKVFNKTLQDLYTSLNFEKSINIKTNPKIIFQGGLGHPLKLYKFDDLDVIMKDATNGAWYGECCENCEYYPCHDALMALRVLPGDKLQVCLMNEQNVYELNGNEEERKKQFQKCLKIYNNANFRRNINNE